MFSTATGLIFFEKINELDFGSGPNVRFKSLSNQLAADFDSAIIIGVADVLQQVWHFRERTPFPIGGKALFPFALARFGFRIIVHKLNIRDAKPGYKAKMVT